MFSKWETESAITTYCMSNCPLMAIRVSVSTVECGDWEVNVGAPYSLVFTSKRQHSGLNFIMFENPFENVSMNSIHFQQEATRL